MPDEEKLLCPKEAAKFLAISAGTLAVWRCNKTYNLPYIKIGNRVRYKFGELLEWVNSRSQIYAG